MCHMFPKNFSLLQTIYSHDRITHNYTDTSQVLAQFDSGSFFFIDDEIISS